MALLAVQQSAVTGLAVSFAAASAGGDTFGPYADAVLLIKNGGASAITATIVVPGLTKFRQAQPDIAISVAAGAEVAVSGFDSDLATDGVISVTYSAVTSVTVALVALA